MSKLSNTRIIPGMTVYYGTTRHLVTDLASATHVLIRDDSGKLKTVAAADLTADIDTSLSPPPDLAAIDSSKWGLALEIYETIAPLVELGASFRTRADVQKVADTIGKNIATVYRWLSDYEATGLVSSLLRKPRKDAGHKRLDAKVEAIIQEVIENFYLTVQSRTPTKTAYEVRKICKQRGLQPPDPSTVRNRIFAINEEHCMRRRRGSKAANENFAPIRGSFPGADFPLAVVQIDHTPMDVIIVDDEHRKAIRRPYLTIATDVDSKMCVGYYVSLDPPGALATGLCISRSILGKEAFLAKLGIDDLTWPCWGVMNKIHTDNAKEFRGTMLGKAAEQYGIVSERRPKGRPNYGGTVERAFRTFMHEVHNELPGTTFSSVKSKFEYDSEGRAVMTLDALEKWFTLFILGVYHQQPHNGNDGLPPIVKWERGIFGTDTTRGTGIPMRASDEDRLKLDFMPFMMRTVQEYGIQFLGFSYWCDPLRRFIHAKDPKSRKLKREFVCRYDPRDLSKIWMYEPESEKYIEVPYRDLSRPPVSLWELKDAKKQLRAEAASVTNEELIFKTIDKMRNIVATETAKTKAARTRQQRRKQWESSEKVSMKDTAAKRPKPPLQVEEEPEVEDFTPYDGIRES